MRIITDPFNCPLSWERHSGTIKNKTKQNKKKRTEILDSVNRLKIGVHDYVIIICLLPNFKVASVSQGLIMRSWQASSLHNHSCHSRRRGHHEEFPPESSLSLCRALYLALSPAINVNGKVLACWHRVWLYDRLSAAGLSPSLCLLLWFTGGSLTGGTLRSVPSIKRHIVILCMRK